MVIKISAESISCYFCGESEKLETHHIVPRRHGGSDDDENLVDVCPTCHQKLESLYDRRFYMEIGAQKPDPVLDEHNGQYYLVDIDEPEIEDLGQLPVRSFDVRIDSTDHFQFYCKGCGDAARVDKVLIEKEKREFCFVLYCERCGVEGQRKIYPNMKPDRRDICRRPADQGYIREKGDEAG